MDLHIYGQYIYNDVDPKQMEHGIYDTVLDTHDFNDCYVCKNPEPPWTFPHNIYIFLLNLSGWRSFWLVHGDYKFCPNWNYLHVFLCDCYTPSLFSNYSPKSLKDETQYSKCQGYSYSAHQYPLIKYSDWIGFWH